MSDDENYENVEDEVPPTSQGCSPGKIWLNPQYWTLKYEILDPELRNIEPWNTKYWTLKYDDDNDDADDADDADDDNDDANDDDDDDDEYQPNISVGRRRKTSLISEI